MNLHKKIEDYQYVITELKHKRNGCELYSYEYNAIQHRLNLCEERLQNNKEIIESEKIHSEKQT